MTSLLPLILDKLYFHQFWITVLQRNVQLERDNTRMCKQLDELKIQQTSLKDQLEALMSKCQREINEGRTIQNIQEQQKKIINEYVSHLLCHCHCPLIGVI